MRVLVTGATGFVGSHLVDRLLHAGDSVRAVLLPGESVEAERLRRRAVDVRVGDLGDGADLTAVVAGVDLVIHCAGLVRIASRGDVWRVNVGGTERLLAASARAGLSRFVYMSSVAVYGHAPPPVTEQALKRPVGAYGESKWVAEQALWRFHAEHGLPAVALRPCIIYGPNDDKISPLLRRFCRARLVPLPAGGCRLLDLVYVSDVVEAALAAATNPTAVGRAYNITDGETHSYRAILAAAGRITGRRQAIIPIPGRAFVLALQTALRVMQIMDRPGDWAGQIGRLRGLDLDIHYTIDAARRDLGYSPRVSLAEGLRRTLAPCEPEDERPERSTSSSLPS